MENENVIAKNDVENENTSQNADKLKKIPKKFYIIGAIAVIVIAAIIAVICIISAASRTIVLNDYIKTEYGGCNEYGSVKVTLDWDAIEEKYASKLSLKEVSSVNMNDLDSIIKSVLGKKYDSPIQALRGLISINVDKSTDLSNGDIVNYTFDVPEKIEEVTNAIIKCSDGEITVSELPEAKKFDAFKQISLTFEGIEPKGKAYVKINQSSPFSHSDIKLSKEVMLCNGETVTVSINEDAIRRYAAETGRVPESTIKKYEVTGLSFYASEIDDIKENTVSALRKSIEEGMEKRIQSGIYNSQPTVVENITYLGTCVKTSKDKNKTYNNNLVLLAYKVDVRNTYSSYDQVNTYYTYYGYDNVLVTDKGELESYGSLYRTNNKVEFDSGLTTGWIIKSHIRWNYWGSSSFDEMKDSILDDVDYICSNNIADIK